METGRTEAAPDHLEDLLQEDPAVITVPVRGEGVFLTQALPARRVQCATDVVGSANWAAILPASPKRARATLVADAPVYVSEKGLGGGLYLPAGVQYEARHRGAVAVKATGMPGAFADPVVLTVAQPAAGTGVWTVTVPAGQAWELISVRATLTTSAVAGNRIPELQIRDNFGNVACIISTNLNLAASGSRTFSWFKGGSGTSGGGAQNMGLPDFAYLPAGWQVRFSVFGMDAADQLDAGNLAVRIAQTTATVGTAVELWAD